MSISINYNNTVITWSDLKSLQDTLSHLSEATPRAHYIAHNLSVIQLSCTSCFIRTICCCPCGDSYDKGAEEVLRKLGEQINGIVVIAEYSKTQAAYSSALENFRTSFQGRPNTIVPTTIQIDASKQKADAALAAAPAIVPGTMPTGITRVTRIAPAHQPAVNRVAAPLTPDPVIIIQASQLTVPSPSTLTAAFRAHHSTAFEGSALPPYAEVVHSTK